MLTFSPCNGHFAPKISEKQTREELDPDFGEKQENFHQKLCIKFLFCAHRTCSSVLGALNVRLAFRQANIHRSFRYTEGALMAERVLQTPGAQKN